MFCRAVACLKERAHPLELTHYSNLKVKKQSRSLKREKEITRYSQDELKQSEMQQEFPQKCMRFFNGDVRDRDRLAMAMREVNSVVHATALKPVPATEYNSMGCISINVYGAENVIAAAISKGG